MIRQEWFSVQQSAEYMGLSRRSIDRAILLKKNGLANNDLDIKLVGNQYRIKKSSLDEIDTIITYGRRNVLSSNA